MIRKLLFFFVLLFCGLTNAQTWNPFSWQTLNLYETPNSALPTNTRIFSFSEVADTGGVSVYTGYLRPSGEEAMPDTSCAINYWVAHKLKHPWFGSRIIADGSSIRIRQAAGDTLYFDFTATVGDTLWISTGSEKIYGVCSSHQNETVLGYDDEVIHFVLGHTDSLGSPIVNSALHGKDFRLGKDLGFIDYFNLDAGAQNYQFVTMIGNRMLNAGKHSFKYSDCFAFPIGSSYQINETVPYIVKYVRYDITNLVENASSFQITSDVHTHTRDYTQGGSSSPVESDVYETGVVTNRSKYELITSNFDDPGIYQLQDLSRQLFCGDTVFRIHTWPNLVETVCLDDSIITYYEIDPLGSSFSQSFQQFRSYSQSYTQNSTQGPAYNTWQLLQYLEVPNCTFGYPWYLGLEEKDETFQLAFEGIGNNRYQFSESYDKVEVYSVDGKPIIEVNPSVFELDENRVYVVAVTKSGQRYYVKLTIRLN